MHLLLRCSRLGFTSTSHGLHHERWFVIREAVFRILFVALIRMVAFIHVVIVLLERDVNALQLGSRLGDCKLESRMMCGLSKSQRLKIV